jgi:nicotinamide phosphoribosyltransferase
MKTTRNNIITRTDSYKLNHWNQYPKGTQYVYSYFESRKGATFDETVFFGLQAILKTIAGTVVTQEGIDDAAKLCKAHFGSDTYFNRAMWDHILHKHGGKLPVRIKAVPEGMPVTVNNILMSVENTDPVCFSLTNALESLLTHVWYPSTVASLSRSIKKIYKSWLDGTAESDGGLLFMLHDFGYRGVSSDESAAIGGAAHLVNFMGTDTVPALEFIVDFYSGNKDYTGIAYSVAATEHSIMTSLGRDDEDKVVEKLLREYPKGILSCVADSYNYYNFVEYIVGMQFRTEILLRDGIFVVRPDSVTDTHKTPEELCLWTLKSLWKNFGGTINNKKYKVINPKVRVLWGDGIDRDGIVKIINMAVDAGFSVENFATFGMGGGLLQKVNRDTQRFAFKSSAQCRDGVWHDIFKDPLDSTKKSKRGKLALVKDENGDLVTVPLSDTTAPVDILQTVFENGLITKEYTFEEVRVNAKL